MKRSRWQLVVPLLALLTIAGCAGTFSQSPRYSPAPPEFVSYLQGRDFCQRATYVSATRLPAMFRDGHWLISVRLPGGPLLDRSMTLTSLVAPPLGVKNGQLVLVFGSRTMSDQNRYWGNVLPILTALDGTEYVAIDDLRTGRYYCIPYSTLMHQLGEPRH